MFGYWAENKKGKYYLINIIPRWKSRLSYAKVSINSIEFKLFNRDKWKFKVILPILQTFRYVKPDCFEDDLRDIIKIVEEREKSIKKKLNRYLGTLDIY